MNDTNNRVLTTRPTLAARLIEAGETVTTAVNPFDENKAAWLFDITENALSIAAEYYKRLNKPLPGNIQRAAERMRAEAAARGETDDNI